jgi:hypothetical protein
MHIPCILYTTFKKKYQSIILSRFFKALKQNLKIKTFVGTGMNAIQVQIWSAVFGAWPIFLRGKNLQSGIVFI